MMKYLVQPIVGDLLLNKENYEINNGCAGYYPCNCYDYEICYTPTGPKMIQAGINPIDINID